MPRVVPSQVVELIDQLLPQLRANDRSNVGSGPQLGAILAVAKEVAPELLTLTGQDLNDYSVALAMGDYLQGIAIASGRVFPLSEHRGKNPIALLRQALAKCPDEAPAPGTTELMFIPDGHLRDSIRQDISAANVDLANGEYKGATVLAGSATEALLLWAVQRAEGKRAGAITAAVGVLVTAGTLSQKPSSNPEQWSFAQLIEVALELGLISSETATQARLGKDFRNLIHPGRSARLGQVCDRATAFSALAAVEHVVRCLTP
jgi:hypothetical protein